MTKIYVIKHFWDKDTYATKVEPDWVVSSSKYDLDNEQTKISSIVKQILSSYDEIINTKPQTKIIDGFNIYFCKYLTKDDPDPTNQRKVTDITFVVSKKKINYKQACNYLSYRKDIVIIQDFSLIKKLLVAIVILAILYIGYQNMPKMAKETNFQNHQPVKQDRKTQLKKEQKISKKEIKKQQNTKSDLINKHIQFCKQLAIEYKTPDKCYQYYLNEFCNDNKTKSCYNKWIKDNKKGLDECAFIDNPKKDNDRNKIKNKKLKRFLTYKGECYGKEL